MMLAPQQQQQQQQQHQRDDVFGKNGDHHDDTNLDTLRLQMEKQRQFLQSSFSCRPFDQLSSPEGYLYGSSRHVSITYDAFSIYIYRLPDGESFHSVLFVDGKQ